MDCNGEYCVCSFCINNSTQGGTCSRCFTCTKGQKADASITECFKDVV